MLYLSSRRDAALTPPVVPAAAGGGRRANAVSSTPLPSADRVWAAYVAAVGGVDTAAPGTGTIMRGWDDRPEGRYAKFEVAVAGADRYRITLTGPELTLSQGLYGDVARGVANNTAQTLSSPATSRACGALRSAIDP